MNTECKRSALELASTINGEAWYGDSLREILEGVTAEQAWAHPVPNAHSIWEIVVHLDAWIRLFSGAMQGIPLPPWPGMSQEQDWPPVNAEHDEGWRESLRLLFEHHLEFAEKMKRFGDERLEWAVPGRTYNFSRLFRSASLHAVYHGGQIALLKKAATR
jgi:hypothetical protein